MDSSLTSFLGVALHSSLGIGCSLNSVLGVCLRASFTAHVGPFVLLDSLAAASDGPSSYFIGLPIPAAAGLLVAVIISTLTPDIQLGADDWWVPLMLVSLGILMVSNVRFRTFKATRLGIRAFALIITVLAAISALAVVTSPAIAIVGLMSSYLALESQKAFGVTQPEEELEDEDDYELIDLRNLDPLLEDGEEELVD